MAWQDPRYTKPLPTWQQQPTGGYGYAPTPGPASGSNNPLPGTSGVNAPMADIYAAQARNAAAQRAPAPAPSSGGGGGSAPAPAQVKSPTAGMSTNHAFSQMQAGWTGNEHVHNGITFVKAANGQWLPKGHSKLAQLGVAPASPSVGGGAPAGPAGPTYDSILMDLANAGGRPNTGALKLRLEGAREHLERNRRSQSDSLMSQLSELGLLGDGATVSGLGRLEEGLGEVYGNSVNQIYADEYDRADNRMMEALSLLTGRDMSNLDREVDWFTAKSNDKIGLKNASANMRSADASMKSAGAASSNAKTNRLRAKNDYRLGLGNLQLGSDDAFLRAISMLEG